MRSTSTARPVVHEPVCEVPADAVAALDRPHPLTPVKGSTASDEDGRVAGLVRVEPSHLQHPTGQRRHAHLVPAPIDDLDRGLAFVQSIPLLTSIGFFSFTQMDVRAGGRALPFRLFGATSVFDGTIGCAAARLVRPTRR